MVKINDSSGYRILVIAILISLAWHILCLFSIKVISVPALKDTAGFSKVSFLGPILSRVGMEVRAAPAQRSLLERRYQKIVGAISYGAGEAAIMARPPYDSESVSMKDDIRLSAVIDEAVNVDKMEPDYPAE